MPTLKTYLVGGAVRDQLLNKPVKERDWVVVGSTPEDMIALGYKPVGKDFPVFLHPTTHEEYALARSEKKVGPGYKGFVFHATPDISLEQDLFRRDLTINAIAQDQQNGELIDPYHGVEDLQKKCLRHVSEAFVEDPVRLLRVARFAAYLPQFSIHPDTMLLLKQMVADGEVDALVPERVWAELMKTLSANDIQPFFQTLQLTNALNIIFPQLNESCLDYDLFTKATKQNIDNKILLIACLFHQCECEQTISLLKHLKAPKQVIEFIPIITKRHAIINHWTNLDAQQILQWFLAIDAFRREERFKTCLQFIALINSELVHMIEPLYQQLKTISIQPLLDKGIQGAALGQALYQEQLNMVTHYLKSLSV